MHGCSSNGGVYLPSPSHADLQVPIGAAEDCAVRAAALLQDLVGRGVQVEVHGTNLIVDGPADALPDELIDRLTALKAELLGLPGWCCQRAALGGCRLAEAYFDERAAMREHEGGLSAPKPSQLLRMRSLTGSAFIRPWPPIRGTAASVVAEQAETGNTLLPVLAPGGHVWVHDRCCDRWHAARRREACAAQEAGGRQVGFTGWVAPAREVTVPRDRQRLTLESGPVLDLARLIRGEAWTARCVYPVHSDLRLR